MSACDRPHAITGVDMLRLRRAVGENQCEFWSRYGVKQSVCSRYESGRALPRALRVLIHLHLSGTITDEALAGAVAAQRLDSDVE